MSRHQLVCLIRVQEPYKDFEALISSSTGLHGPYKAPKGLISHISYSHSQGWIWYCLATLALRQGWNWFCLITIGFFQSQSQKYFAALRFPRVHVVTLIRFRRWELVAPTSE